MATTPTTTTSFAAPLWLCLLRPLLRCSPARSRAFAAFGSLACAPPGFSALGLQPRRGLSMPSELLQRWSSSRLDCGLPGSESTPQPRAGIESETGGRRQSFTTAWARPLRPRTLCKSKRLRSEFGGNPPPSVPRGGGGRREAGGGRARAGERPGAQAAKGRGGRGKRAREHALTLAPRSLRLVLATSWGGYREKLAGASFPTGIKQVMASHLPGFLAAAAAAAASLGAAQFQHRNPVLQAPSGRALQLPWGPLPRRPLPPGAQPAGSGHGPPPPAPPPKSPAGFSG